jgi:hypothetical protein
VSFNTDEITFKKMTLFLLGDNTWAIRITSA